MNQQVAYFFGQQSNSATFTDTAINRIAFKIAYTGFCFYNSRIFAFDGDGHFRQYEGGYTDYLEARKREKAENSGADFEGREGGRQKAASGRGAGDKASGKENGSGKPTWDKGEKKLKFTYKEQKEFETIEDDIAALEERITALDKDIEASAHDFVKLNQLMAEKEGLEAALEEKMERWMYLEELAAKIAAQ